MSYRDSVSIVFVIISHTIFNNFPSTTTVGTCSRVDQFLLATTKSKIEQNFIYEIYFCIHTHGFKAAKQWEAYQFSYCAAKYRWINSTYIGNMFKQHGDEESCTPDSPKPTFLFTTYVSS